MPATRVLERRLAAALLLLATALILALHRLEPGFDPLHRFMSEYVLGAHGWVMRSVFFVLAASGALLAHGTRETYGRGVVFGLVGWSVGMVLAGVCTTDASLPGSARTPVGIVHDLAADLAFASVMVAAYASSARGRWVVLAMLLTVLGARIVGLPGLEQRAFGALAIGWLLTLALARG